MSQDSEDRTKVEEARPEWSAPTFEDFETPPEVTAYLARR
ncbi:MAG TPA: pyrroloquinoline quinone precursor peptide PqqA [Pseudonocardiaceae bacterium]|jgi:hypothetical protein|nr:pyrroloquinoline quinone precursor peptide PqqA [Pseudonocardiaceae bacterium]